MNLELKRKIKKIFRSTSKQDNNPELVELLIKQTPENLGTIVLSAIIKKMETLPPLEAARFIFDLDNKLYIHEGYASVRYGNGVHSKHRHINYHKFFTGNIKSGDNVLDIGCSAGELTRDIADQAYPGEVIGIEIEKSRYELAIQEMQKPNLTFVLGDATKDLPESDFDVITLSNVLEHIEDRSELLKILNGRYKPNRLLIRVPLFERDWRVPFKRELGLDYKLDDTHCIEYTQEIFEKEIRDAGLDVKTLQIRWGEIWAVIVPNSK